MRYSQPLSYSTDYYDQTVAGSLASAEVIAPIALSLLAPTSVCDVGCGSGAWLVPFAARGCRILGMDGPWAMNSLLIDASDFRAVDLTQPITASGPFDLALCLEVAEHLPPDCAWRLVSLLTDIAPAILFSAAAPGQGGVDHLNEQPMSFWQDLFSRRGFTCFDAVRRQVWKNHLVQPWYRFNTRLFIRKNHLATRPHLMNDLGRLTGRRPSDSFLERAFLQPYSWPWIQWRFQEHFHRGLARLRSN